MGLPFENADYNEDEVGAKKMNELTDVVLTNIQNNEVLVYNNGNWENQAQSGGSSITELDDIPGVTITNAQDNQFLKYDNGEWINANVIDNDTDNLNDLTDTLLTSPFGNDEVLKYLNGKWVNGNIPIEKLSNVFISNLQDGETLRYVHQNLRWENVNNIDTLNELSDVTVSSNLQNHVLKYNNSLGVYKNDFLNLTDLGDTNISTLVNDYSLIYNNGIWSAGKVNINNLNGLTWTDVNNNEIIRKTSSTTADGAGMTLHDTSSPTFPQTSYFKDVSYFGRHGQLTIPFGVNRFESTFAGYNQRIIPYSPILLSTTPVSGLYLHHLPSINDYNVRVGVNNQYPSQDFQVGTTMYVDDTNKRVGINQASPSVDLEVLNTMYVDSNTRRVGIVDASPSVTFQVGTTLYVNQTTGQVGIGISTPDENLEVDGSIQIDSNGPARLKFQQTGQNPYAVAEIDGEPDGSGGQLEFFTSDNGTGVSKKLVIRKDGATEIYSDGIGLSILSTDGFSQQAQIYHGSTGTQDLIIDTDAPATTTKGISFRTQAGVQRLRIGYFGELGFSPTNDIGTSGQILESRGAGNTPHWVNPAGFSPNAYGVFFVNGTLTVAANTRQQVNNLSSVQGFPSTNITLSAQPGGNLAQNIQVNGGAGNYLITYAINAQQLNGSTLINAFEIYQNGSRIHYNWYVFSGIENITGTIMVNQTTSSAVNYTFAATASAGGDYRLNGFNSNYTQISIMKLF